MLLHFLFYLEALLVPISYPARILTQAQTFFSTNFFNFLAPEGERVVSGWIWLYFLFITAFTVATSAIYYTLSQRNRQKIAKKHKTDSELLSRTPKVITLDAKKSNTEIQMGAVSTETVTHTLLQVQNGVVEMDELAEGI
jgi:hypothetical protein